MFEDSNKLLICSSVIGVNSIDSNASTFSCKIDIAEVFAETAALLAVL